MSAYRAFLVVMAVGLTAACGDDSATVSAAGTKPAAAVSANASEDPPQQPVRPSFSSEEQEVAHAEGRGPSALPSFRAADYRMLIVCHGDLLRIRDATHEITRTKCDGVTLDARVYSDTGVKALRVSSTPKTRWTVRIARAA